MINVKRMIEFCWQHEEDIRRAIAEKRLDNGGVVTGGGGHCRVSDPTAQKAIHNVSDVPCVEVEYGAYVNDMRNVMTIKRPLQWLKAAHWTKEHYAEKPQGELIKLKYNESLLRNDIVEIMGISQATYYVMLSDIFTYAEGLAAGLKLISPKR